MAIKAKKESTIEERYAITINSEKKFTEMMLEAESRGLVKQTRKQLNNMKSFVGIMQANPTQQLLHSSDRTHGKMRKLISCGDHNSPLQQQQDSSVRVNEMVQQFNIAKRMSKAEADLFTTTTGKQHLYMLTLTRPNSHKNKLDEDFTKHRARVSKMMKALKDGAERGNGLQLVGGKYLGAFVSHEITVNEEKLANKQSQKLYHPHTHVILIVDDVLKVKATKDILLDKWRALNSDLSLSKDAFDLRSAYDQKNGSEGVSAVKEVVKYTVKPDTWNKLSNIHDDYQVEVFSELYNAVRRKKMKQSHGILDTAMNFLNVFDRFRNAMSFSIMDEFPDIVSQLTELVFDKNKGRFGGYNAFYKRELTADEIVYYNRSLIEDVLVSEGVVERIDEFFEKYSDDLKSKRQKIYAEVFKGFTFATVIDELTDKLDEFAAFELKQKNDLKAYDIKLLSESILAKLNVDKRDFRESKGDMATNHYRLHMRVDMTSLNAFARQEWQRFTDLFEQYVAPLTGVNTSIEIHNKYADFMQKQGLFLHNQKDTEDIELYVDATMPNNYPYADYLDFVEDYLGTALFGDDWEQVKQ